MTSLNILFLFTKLLSGPTAMLPSLDSAIELIDRQISYLNFCYQLESPYPNNSKSVTFDQHYDFLSSETVDDHFIYEFLFISLLLNNQLLYNKHKNLSEIKRKYYDKIEKKVLKHYKKNSLDYKQFNKHCRDDISTQERTENLTDMLNKTKLKIASATKDGKKSSIFKMKGENLTYLYDSYKNISNEDIPHAFNKKEMADFYTIKQAQKKDLLLLKKILLKIRTYKTKQEVLDKGLKEIMIAYNFLQMFSGFSGSVGKIMMEVKNTTVEIAEYVGDSSEKALCIVNSRKKHSFIKHNKKRIIRDFSEERKEQESYISKVLEALSEQKALKKSELEFFEKWSMFEEREVEQVLGTEKQDITSKSFTKISPTTSVKRGLFRTPTPFPIQKPLPNKRIHKISKSIKNLFSKTRKAKSCMETPLNTIGGANSEAIRPTTNEISKNETIDSGLGSNEQFLNKRPTLKRKNAIRMQSMSE